jgi:peroxiredoxin
VTTHGIRGSDTGCDTVVGEYPKHSDEDIHAICVQRADNFHSMKAWQKNLGAKEAGIRFLGDAQGLFTQAMDAEFDATPLLGNKRSKRYAALTEDGKITKIFIEPDNTSVTGEFWPPPSLIREMRMGKLMVP